MGYGFYTTIFSHFLNENMMNYGRQLTLTNLDLSQFDFGAFMGDSYLHSMMLVAIKQVYGYVIWFALLLAFIFLLCDIPAVRTNIRKVPLWPVLAISASKNIAKNCNVSDSIGHISLDFFDYDRIISLDFFNSYQIICLDYFFFCIFAA